jgi:hypothetical protein
MAKYQFSDIERMAIWKAYKSKCEYCRELIRFSDLEIDHILPESLLDNPDDLEEIKTKYGLGSEFEINSYYNWIPSCSRCNRTKSNKIYSKSGIFHLLEMVAKPKHEEISRIEQSLQKTMKKEGFLTRTEANQVIEEYIKDLIVNNLIMSPATKRRDRWIDEYLSKAYQLITEKVAFSVVENLPNNELFITVVLQATSIALRNHQEEKLEALRNAVVNSVLPSSADDDIKLMFLDLVDELKVSHLRLLRMLYEPDKYSNEETNFLNELEKHKHLYCHFPKQLIAHNLISLGAFYNSADAIVEEENNYRFPLSAPVPYTKITSSGVPIVRYSSYSQEKRMKIKLREMERTSRNIDLVIQLIRGNKSKDCITEFGRLFIQFIQSSVGDS